MPRNSLPLQSLRLKNFKAVRDSGVVRFTPLTVFIGNNGSGKSSLVEGLETMQSVVVNGLDAAMQQWRGFENIWNQASPHTLRQVGDKRAHYTNPMGFELRGTWLSKPYSASMEINTGPGGNEIFIHREEYTIGSRPNRHQLARDTAGWIYSGYVDDPPASEIEVLQSLNDGESLLAGQGPGIMNWQFLSLAPQSMGNPIAQKRTGGTIRLAKDGSNIAEFLLSIRKINPDILDGIVETLQYVLPYAADVQPALTSELERTVYLQLTEKDFKLPGWLLSTGTLRVLALLAVLRHPAPPRLLIIEEIENGLDPRTINLIVEEMRGAIESGGMQIIITTHSPYLLDLLDLSQIVVVERDEGGAPVFTRPGDHESLKKWTDRFSPGRLYTMDQLGRKSYS